MTIGALLNIIKSDKNQQYLGNILVGFNMAGIFCLILYSIRIRKLLLEMQIDLDVNKDTPSDYALLVRNIPLKMTQEELKEKFESIFKVFNVKVYEVNYCYKVDEMIALNKVVAKMNFLKGMCKIHNLKQMKKLGCPKAELETHKDYVKPTKKNKFRIWRSRVLDR
jgi:hypothetical protein